MEKIDFVLPWVDGDDVKWQVQKKQYAAAELGMAHGIANSEARYRDWGVLRYWFRAVERFAPWVNQVFFITCGQKPEWLDEAHPKLRLVNHRDYIPAQYLPTFQSNTIELNLHRINDLSEHFVLFNDDTFLLRPVQPDFFFREGYPVLDCKLGIPTWLAYNHISRVMLNNSCVLRMSFDIERLIWKYWLKYFNVKRLGFKYALKNCIAFAINKYILLGDFGHLPEPHLKSTFEKIWAKQPQILDTISSYKFRHDDCVNQWLACAWNMIEGHFFPVDGMQRGKSICVCDNILDVVCDAIRNMRYSLICINDDATNETFHKCALEIAYAFHEILPDKSQIEKFDI